MSKLKNKKSMVLKILFAIGCVAVYSLIIYVIAPFFAEIHIKSDVGGDAAGRGMAQGFAYLGYSVIFCVILFIISIFLSRHLLGSLWWAVLFAVLGLSIVYVIDWYPKYRKIHVEKTYYDTGELMITEEKKGYASRQTKYNRDGSIERISTWRNGNLLGLYQLFYDNGQVMIDGIYDKNGKLTAKYYTIGGEELVKSDGSGLSEDEFWDYYRGNGKYNMTE